MATNFPTSLDTTTQLPDSATPTSSRSNPDLATAQNNQSDAIMALEAKVGVNSSTVATSLDYLLKSTSSISPGHQHDGPDIVSSTTVTAALADKGGQVFSVKAYGAKGDGITDDTAAIQAAINAASLGGGIVYAPSGSFIFSSTLAIPVGVSLWGTPPAEGGSLGTVFSSQGYGIELAVPSASTYPSSVLRDFWLDLHSIGTTSGITVLAATAATTDDRAIKNVRIMNTGGSGVIIGAYIAGFSMRRVVVNGFANGGAGYAGIQINGTDADLDRCTVDGSLGNYGINVTSSNVCTIRGCSIGGTLLAGIKANATPGVEIVGCGIDHNQQAAVLFSGGSSGSLIGCTIHDNGLEANHTYSEVFVEGGSRVAIVGNDFNSSSANQPAANIGVATDGSWASIGRNVFTGDAELTVNATMPSVPASGVASSVFPVDAMLYITAGSSTCEVQVTPPGGALTTLYTLSAAATGTFRIPAGATVTLTYAAAPTWTAVADN